jgi:hypothetical protein
MLRGDLQAAAAGITELESLFATAGEHPQAAYILRRIIAEEQEAYEALSEQYARVQNSLR